MDFAQLAIVLFMLLFFAAVLKSRRRRKGGRRSRGPGPGAAGAVFEMLNEDKRRAIEIVVEERAEERDPETADGDLPQLEKPK